MVKQAAGDLGLPSFQLQGGKLASLNPLNKVVEEQLATLSAFAAFLGFAVQCRENFPSGVPGVEQMGASDQEIVPNQTRDVGG